MPKRSRPTNFRLNAMQREEVKLTGLTRYREGWFQKIILEVEEEITVIDYSIPDRGADDRFGHERRWRDANSKDVRQLAYLADLEKAKSEGRPPPPPPDRPFRFR